MLEQLMPEQLFSTLTSSDFVAFGIGIVLLVAGRKLFWLALGGVGFLAGLFVASNILNLSSAVVELGVALFAGVVCAFLAVVAQKIAVALAGFVLGGAGAVSIASFFEPSALSEGTPWVLLAALVGAILGTIVAPSLFEASLAAFTSLVGAMLVVSRLALGSPHETWVFIGLTLFGIILQTRGRRERVETRPVESRA